MRRSALAVVAALAVLAGCSTAVQGVASPVPGAVAPTAGAPLADDPSDGRFTDGEGRFRIAAPPGWTPDTSGAQGTAVVFLDPTPTEAEGGPFNANINVLVVPAVADLPATVVGARTELDGLGSYTAMTDEEVALADGTRAHLLGGTFIQPGSKFELRNLQLFTVAGGSTTVVTGTAPAASWESFAATFDESLRTLTVAS